MASPDADAPDPPPSPSAGAGSPHAGDAAAELAALRREVDTLRERLDLVQEFGRIGCFERDPATGQGWWDRHMYRLWGLPDPGPGAPSPPHARASELVDPRDLQLGAFERSMRTAGRHEARIRIHRPDGQWRHLHTQWRVDHDAEGRATRVAGVHIDDTQVWELAQRAEQMGQEMEAALGFAQIGLWRQDARTLHVWPDQRACEMLGLQYQADGYPASRTRAQAHPDDLPVILASFLTTRDTGRPSEALARYPRPEGGWRHTLSRRIRRDGADGQPETYLGVMIDISDIVGRQREAAEAGHRIGLAQSALGLGIWSGQAGEDYAWWDEHMFRLRGVDSPARQVSRAEALGYLHPGDRARLEHAHHRLDAQGSPWQLEFRVVWPDGTVRWLASRSQMMADPLTGAPHHFGVAWDVTDTHLAQQALRESERVRAENAAKAQFLSRISHDLRTPLNAVLGFTQLMRGAESDLPAGHARWLDHVDDAGRQLLALIDELLELAQSTPAPAAEPGAPASVAHPTAPARVLYIEDNPVNALLVEELVRAHPHLRAAVQLRVATTGAEGLEVAAQWQPALVLVDMQLPDMDGLAVHRALRTLPGLADTPCVALSANTVADDVAEARAAGFADYWTKPIEFDRFTEGLQRLLAQP